MMRQYIGYVEYVKYAKYAKYAKFYFPHVVLVNSGPYIEFSETSHLGG